MELLRSLRWIFGLSCAVAFLAACGGGGFSASSGSGSQSDDSVARLRTGSWISPASRKNDLLYVSDSSSSIVHMYSYPQGVEVGTLTGFRFAAGLCSDAAGNVFVTSTLQASIVEYAHGATEPKAILNDPNQYPGDCAVDASTGDLAVTNGLYVGGSGVSIYRKAKGTPTLYNISNISLPLWCTYDDKGNLFVDGLTGPNGSFAFAELPSGAANFISLTLDAKIAAPGGVRWDGKYVAVSDVNNPVVYQVEASGSDATVVGSTPLLGMNNGYGVSGFWIPHPSEHAKNPQGKVFIGASSEGFSPSETQDFGFWKYPKGGSPTKIVGFVGGDFPPYGVTLSAAK